MVHRRERVMRGGVTSEHLVQLFDDEESRAETVASFFFDGWKRNESLMVVARPENWVLASQQLCDRGCPVSELVQSRRLVILDAAQTLASFLRIGRPVSEPFETNVALAVRNLSAEFDRPVRIYGEMVDLLASQGDFAAAQDLEQMWNDLSAECSITLLCGYASANFGDERSADALRLICAAHDHALAKPTDMLGSWLLAERHTSRPLNF